MAKQSSSLISRGAGFAMPSEARHVERYVTPARSIDPASRRRRLSDRLASLLAEARRCGDAATARQLQCILQGVGRRSRTQAMQERRLPEA